MTLASRVAALMMLDAPIGRASSPSLGSPYDRLSNPSTSVSGAEASEADVGGPIAVVLSSRRRQLKKPSRMQRNHVDIWLESTVQIAMLIAVIALIALMLV